MSLTAKELNSRLAYCFGNEIEYLHSLSKGLMPYSAGVMLGAGPGIMALALLEVNNLFSLHIVDNGSFLSIDAHLKAAGVRDKCTFWEGDSWDLAVMFEDYSLDLLIVDADHSYEAVLKDITAWYPKLRTGSYILFHDYVDIEENSNNGVERAVKEFLEKVSLREVATPGISKVYRI